MQTFGLEMLKKGQNASIQKQLKEDRQLPFYELNYLKVEDDKVADFELEINSVHSTKQQLYKAKSTRLFKSFAAFSKKKAKGMYIELIHWENLKDFELSKQLPLPDHYDVLTSIRMRPADIETNDLEEIIESKNAVEFGARTIKRKGVFPLEREKFLSNIIVQPGYKFDREFVSIDDDLGIILFGWEKDQDYINAGNKVKKSLKLLAKTLWYFRLVKNKAFQVGVLVE